MKNSICIFGTGFIGKNVIEHFLNKNFFVYSFSHATEIGLINKNLKHTVIDLIEDKIEIHHESSVRAIIYAVSTSVAGTVNNRIELQKEIAAFDNILKFSEAFPQAKVFLVSSASVYGHRATCSFNEEDDCMPNSLYGELKRSIELFALKNTRNFNERIFIFRVSNLFGPYQSKQGIVFKIIQSILCKEPLTILNNGNTVRDFLYVKDLMIIFEAFINFDKEAGIYNVSSGEGITIKAIVDKSKEILRTSENKIEYVDVNDSNPYNVLNNGKLKATLNEWSTTSLDEALNSTVSWYLENFTT